MDSEAVEFHDSEIGEVTSSGGLAKVLFTPAYIHRSKGVPGVDEGTGWVADVEFTVLDATVLGSPSTFPSDIWGGTLRVGDSVLENLVPVPMSESGPVEFKLELNSGEHLHVAGSSIQIRVTGEYKYVELFPWR